MQGSGQAKAHRLKMAYAQLRVPTQSNFFFNSEILWQELEQSRRKRHLPEDLRRNSFDSSDVSSTPTDRYRKDISPITRDERTDAFHSRAENGPVCFKESFVYFLLYLKAWSNEDES